MPLPPITLSRAEPIRLVSPWDDALDVDATPEDILKAYVSGADLDASRLVLNGEPTWFTIRALNPREKRAVSALIPWEDTPDGMLDGSDNQPQLDASHALQRTAWLHAAHAEYLRFGLVSIEGLEGWEAVERDRYLGLRPYPVDAVAALHPDTALWLGGRVAELSNLDPKKKDCSTS